MNERKLILVKHSCPAINPSAPPNQWHLSELGRARCELLADRLAAYQPGLIVSSHEPKAAETAQLVADRLGLAFQVAEGLQEHDRSNAKFFDDRKEFWEAITEFFEYPNELSYGNETANQAHARFTSAVAGLLKSNAGKTIVVVAHGTVITLYISRITGLEPFDLWKRLGLPSFVVLNLPALELEKVVENVE